MPLAGCRQEEPKAAVEPPFLAATDGAGLAGVVLVVVDTLRADYVGAFGSDRGLTPEIDALARGSHVFSQAIATSSWTRPSIASMFTSRYPTATGVLDENDGLEEEAVTLPEVLANAAGFQTIGVTTNPNITEHYGFDQGFELFEWPHVRRRYPGDFAPRTAAGVTRKALELLDTRDSRRPFFLFALYVDPHAPYLPHPGLSEGQAPEGRFDGSRQQLHRLDRLRLGADPADYERIRYLYSGEVAYLDRWIGALVDGLEERGLLDEVLLVLTADHGEGLWAHGWRGHGKDLYEETVRVPLLIRYPGMSAETARVVDTPVSLVDLAPTVVAALDLPKPPSFLGFDLGPLTRGESRGPGFGHVYTEMDYRGRSLEAMRADHWKLIWMRGANGPRPRSTELYDLQRDPRETENLWHDPQARREAGDLATALKGWSQAISTEAAEGETVALSSLSHETLAELGALGYVSPQRRGSLPAPEGGEASEGAGPLPAVESSDLAFAKSFAAAQVESGIEVSEGDAWLAGSASVLLAREADHSKWQVELWIPAEGAERLPIDIVGHASGGEPVRVRLREPGHYIVEGPLAAASEPTVRLTLECASAAAGADDGSRCIRVQRILLR